MKKLLFILLLLLPLVGISQSSFTISREENFREIKQRYPEAHTYFDVDGDIVSDGYGMRILFTYKGGQDLDMIIVRCMTSGAADVWSDLLDKEYIFLFKENETISFISRTETQYAQAYYFDGDLHISLFLTK